MNKENFDNCVSFHIENGAFMGRLVRLDDVLNVILAKHAYPRPVSAVLAETTVLAVMLSSTIKYEGLFTLQIQSNGPVSLVVVDVKSTGEVRAYAKYDVQHLEHAQNLRKTSGEIEAAPHLLGEGVLAFTVDQGPETELYQGIVELKGKTLAECALRYFKQSEQIETKLRLFLEPPAGDFKKWAGAGIMLQKLPLKGGSEVSDEDAAEAWNEAGIFLDSLTPEEVFNADLSSAELLHRLYHSSQLQVSACKPYLFGCRCSREKLLNTLRSFSEEEISSLAEQGKVKVTCDFCSEQYTFDKGELLRQ